MSEALPARLGELASLIRSKNAGPFMLTIDIMFDEREMYELVRDHPKVHAATFSSIFGVDEDKMDFYRSDVAMAVKVSFPRPWVSGSRDDRDIYGGQVHGPLVDLELDAP